MKPELQEQLFRLMGPLVNGTISSERYATLEQLLYEDAEARRFYFEYLDVDFELRHWQTSQAGPDAVEEMLRHAKESMVVARPRVGRALRYALVVAATLCASLVLHQLLGRPDRGDGELAAPPSVPAAPTAPAEYIATLFMSDDCIWNNQENTLDAGSRLSPGRVKLREGVASIRFDSGALLVLEGPTELEIESAVSATLLSGKMVFRGDEISSEFKLNTAFSTFVDLGTEYAVSLDSDGAGEIHVFEGVVEQFSKGAVGRAVNPIWLTAGQARSFGPKSKLGGLPIRLTEESFIRELPRDVTDPADGLLAYEGFDYETAVLPAPDSGNGGVGWVGPWRTWDNWPKLTLGSAVDEGSLTSVPGATGLSIQQTGAGHMGRELAVPLRLDRDAVYYISFLFRQQGFDQPQPGDPSFSVHLTLLSGKQSQPIEEKLRLAVGRGEGIHGLLGGDREYVRLPFDGNVTYLKVAKIVAGRTRPDQLFSTIYRADGLRIWCSTICGSTSTSNRMVRQPRVGSRSTRFGSARPGPRSPGLSFLGRRDGSEDSTIGSRC